MTTSYKTQKKLLIFTFLFIPVTLLLMFLIYPTFKLLQLSITDWDGIGKTFQYIGLKNYWNVFFKSPEVWIALKNNFLYFFIHLIMIPVEIILAAILCKGYRGFKFFKSITFMPYIINGVAVAYMFSFLYSPVGGPVNSLLEHWGLGFFALNWLGDPNIVNYSLVSVSLWRFSGLHVILFISGILSIPPEYYEAADIDGANSIQKLKSITIPGIKRVVQMVLFLNVRGALQVFDIPFLITNGGPGFASSTFTTYTIDTAFKFDQYGMASAMAVVLMLLICIVSLVQDRLTKLRG